MDPQLLHLSAAFGLAAAAGLNTTLPLLLVGLCFRFGLLGLAAPYSALGSDVALVGLAVLAALEIGADKVPGLDSVAQAVQWPLTLTAGAILFASQASVVTDVAPGLAILVGVLTAGTIHGARAAVRPVLTAGTLGLGNSAASAGEDVLAAGLVATAVAAPWLVPLVLLCAALGVLFVGHRVLGLARRGVARLPFGRPLAGR